MEEIRERQNIVNILNQQSIEHIVAAGGDVNAIIAAYKDSQEKDIYLMCMRFFELGVIYGKKFDRAKSARKEIKTLAGT